MNEQEFNRIENIRFVFISLLNASKSILVELDSIKVEIETEHVLKQLQTIFAQIQMLQQSFHQACLLASKQTLHEHLYSEIKEISLVLGRIIEIVDEKKETVKKVPYLNLKREALNRLL